MHIGYKSGLLTVQEINSVHKTTSLRTRLVKMFRCTCECGKSVDVDKRSLIEKGSCGCLTSRKLSASRPGSKYTDQDVQRMVPNGFEWVNRPYKASDGVELKCSYGHVFKRSIYSLTGAATTCMECSGQIKTKDREKDATQKFLKMGYALVSKYINEYTPVALKCSNNHTFEILPSSVKGFGHCQECRRLDAARKALSGFQTANIILDESNFLKNYTHSRQPFRAKCDSGHSFEKMWWSIQQGHGCPECGGSMKVSGDDMAAKCMSLGFEFVGTIQEQKGDRLRTFVTAKCDSGHLFKQRWDLFLAGHHCKICAFSKTNKAENKISEFLDSLGVTHSIRDRGVIPPKELDFYIPSKSVAIEYCGVYWHSIRTQTERLGISIAKAKAKHSDKLKECELRGIRLITVFEHEFLLNPEVVQSRIQAVLGISKFKVMARKCDVVDCSKEEAKFFMKANHLQGSVGCKFASKLMYNNHTIGVITVGHPGRNHTTSNLELKRLAFLKDWTVQGGASKLFAHMTRKTGSEPIMSYCDLRYGTGSVYKALGFEMVGISAPSPHHYRNLGRYGYEKVSHQSLAKAKNYEDFLTLYDCGHQKWVWSPTIPKGLIR